MSKAGYAGSFTTAHAAQPVAMNNHMWIEMRNVDLRLGQGVRLRVGRLRGEVNRTMAGPASLDDAKSFAIRIVSGTVTMTGDDLAALFNNVVFAYLDAPLKQLKIRTKGSYIVQTGVIHRGVDLPFEMTASLGVLPDGRIRIKPTRLRVLGVDGMRFLGTAGLRLETLLDLSKARGASVHGDDIYLDVTRLMPSLQIQGRLTSIQVHGNAIVQEFVRLSDDSVFGKTVRPDSTIPNFVYFRGGNLRFGKLLMSDTDLLIADGDPRDPFDLYLPRYSEQLVRGTSRTLVNSGLVAVVPDYTTVHDQ